MSKSERSGASTIESASAILAGGRALPVESALLASKLSNPVEFDTLDPPIVARDLIRLHHETYREFWRWSDAAVDHAMLHGSLHTVFGWRIHVGENPNPRSLRNFCMQGNAAEMLRLACCFATERRIEVCAPVHDAILICAPLDRLDEDVARMRAIMAEASRIVLGGFELRTEAKIVCYPDRFIDKRGVVMWKRVSELIERRTAVAV